MNVASAAAAEETDAVDMGSDPLGSYHAELFGEGEAARAEPSSLSLQPGDNAVLPNEE